MKANYDLISEEWVSRRKRLPPKDQVLFDAFIDALPNDARVLDLGCGSGVPIAPLLIEKGCSISPL